MGILLLSRHASVDGIVKVAFFPVEDGRRLVLVVFDTPAWHERLALLVDGAFGWAVPFLMWAAPHISHGDVGRVPRVAHVP